MNWVCPVRYNTMQEAILGMAQQSELELFDPKPVAPEAIAGIQDAAHTILTAIKGYTMPVVIVGDYDADGITSTAILTRLLRYFGCDPRTIIPKRFTDGYGVSSKLLEGVQNSLIITVDNGISAGDVLDQAVNEGSNIVVVLDHHLPDGRQPKCADVIVDPHLAPESNGFMYGDNVIEKHGINRDRTGDREKTRYLCGKQGIFTRDRALIRPGFIRQLETRASTRSASFFMPWGAMEGPTTAAARRGAIYRQRAENPANRPFLGAKRAARPVPEVTAADKEDGLRGPWSQYSRDGPGRQAGEPCKRGVNPCIN